MFFKAAKTLLAATASLALGWASPAMAWGDAGHRMVASIALANVRPATAKRIARLLLVNRQLGTADCPVKTLADAATWPDCLRKEGQRWSYTFPWHYQDSEIPGPGFDIKSKCSYGTCVTAQIERNRMILANKSLPRAQRLEALAFLSHFVGDLHQPLHAAEHEHDAGGNGVKVNWPGHEGDSLHWFWDSAVAERGIATAPGPLVRSYSAKEKAELGGGTVADWAQESWVIARDVVYPQAYGHPVQPGEVLHAPITFGDEQLNADAPIARKRLVQAGLRLAKMLDEALDGAA